MSTFQQSCPGCGRKLELPADAKGRLGKCPACEATFTIGEVARASDNGVLEPAPAEMDLLDPIAEPIPEREPESQPTPTGSPVDQSDQVGSPFAAPIDRFHSPPPPAILQVTECAIEDVLSTAWSIFLARWTASIVPFVVSIVAALVVVVLPLLILGAINDAGAKGLAVLGLIILVPFAFVLSVFLLLGIVRVEIAVARNDDSPLTQMTAPTSMFTRVVGVSLMLFAGVAIACIVMLSFVAIVDAAGAKDLAAILGLLAICVTFLLLFGLMWQLWSWMFVCGDGKGDAMGSLRAAVAISSQNKMTSFFLVLIALALALLGTLMFLVGHVVTVPLTVLLFAVAYLMMTGQVVDDPTETKPH